MHSFSTLPASLRNLKLDCKGPIVYGKVCELRLTQKFRLSVAVAASGLLTLSGFWLHSERTSLLAEKQEQAKNLVAVPCSIIAQQYRLEKEGRLSREEAQSRAIESLRNIRYDGNN